MIFISVTRLRIRFVRFLPLFAVWAIRSLRQVERAPGFQSGSLLPDSQWTFWTMTAWDSQENMRAFMTSGAHKDAMPRLLHWCDEASVAHWTKEDDGLPSWPEADARMRASGRISKVLHPSPQHAGLNYQAPRKTVGGPIHRR
jgi:heme-degrading monooxygenase HmoA